jgi:hypothetical protein
MSLDRYDIKYLVEELLEKFENYKVIQTTRTNIIRTSSTSEPTGHETVVEYTIKRK